MQRGRRAGFWVAGLLTFVCSSGCAGAGRPAAEYSGDSRTPRVPAEQIVELPTAPPGAEVLGHVSADCTSSEGRRRIEHEWLSDVDCSEERLVRALREAAAAQGGDLIVELDCASHVIGESGGVRRRRARCEAGVARRSEMLSAVPLRFEPSRGRASDAWRIRVDFWPACRAPQGRSAVRGDLVRELAVFPVSHVRLGAIRTECEHGCTSESLRDAVLAAAGRIGATDVVEVHCIREGRRQSCTGTAATYALDPARDPSAR